MKKQLLAAAIGVVATGSQAELMITGIIDGPSSSPKAVEFYATTDITDLSAYTIKLQSNSNTGATYSGSYTFEAVAVTAGTFLTLNNESDTEGFSTYFGVEPTYAGSGINFNGDDRVLIVSTDDTTNIIDIFGVIDTDGSGSDWEYTDGWAYRQSAYADSGVTMAPNGGTFDASTWNYSGVDALDGAETNVSSGNIMPVSGVVPAAEEAETVDIGTCGDGNETLISAIQGSEGRGGSSPLKGDTVIVEAIVYQIESGYSGYFIQEEDADSDNDATTSEGLFVYDSSNSVSVGEKIRLVAEVAEYQTITELKSVSAFDSCATDQTLPTAAEITLPVSSLDNFEQVEGMRVVVTNDMFVSDFYGSGYSFENYGQFVASTQLHYQPTEIAEPSEAAYDAAVEAMQLSSLLIDDGSSTKYPDLIPFPNEFGFSNTNYIRIGYQVTNIAGAMHTYDSGSTKFPYFVIPDSTPTFDALQADRTLEPEVDPSANLTIVSMNVLNLFNGVMVDGAVYFPTQDEEDNDTYGDYRGANSAEDYQIQLAKIVAALEALDSDVIGLMEIENDGFDETSSIFDLTTALNATQAEGSTYEFVNPGVTTIGDDAIAVGLLYRPSVVSLVGSTVILDSDNSPQDDDGNALFLDTKNRPSLIQSFKHIATGDQFTVSVNHLKSKGSSCSSLDDPNLDDGQGNCNLTRKKAVQALTQFIETVPTGIDTDNIIFMGDMNAYSKEDPIVAFEEAGYSNLKYSDQSTEVQPYSYSYSGFLGSLDQIMGSESIASRLVSIDDWHINSVESNLFDYDTDLDEYVTNDHYAAEDPYYSSDHDPVIAGFVMVKTADEVSDDVDTDTDSESEDDDNANDLFGGSLGFLMLPMLLVLAGLRSRKK